MIPERLIRKLMGDSGSSLQTRLFRLIMVIGTAGLALGGICGCITGGNIRDQLPALAALIFVVPIAFITLRTGRIQQGAVLTSAIAMYLMLPLNFFASGGIYGGAPGWFLLGFVLTTLTVRGRVKFALLGGGYLVFFLCYYAAWQYPSYVVRHTYAADYAGSFVTLSIVFFVTCAILLFQNAVYRDENVTVRRQKREIEELNRAQNRFFSNMSHEIRTPINTIIGLDEMILREEVSDEVREDAWNIQNASKMLLTLIGDILDMSRIESGKMRIVSEIYDVGGALSDIVNMIWVRAKEKGLSFHVDVAEDIPARLYGDEVRIKQILINLLNNAVKYTHEGSVTLSIQRRKQEGDTVYVAYAVTDTGIGIKKESIPRLFDAFRRVDEGKNRYIEGTGLGLSIVKQLVDLMGGEIAVDSVYQKGSSFVVTLPQRMEGEALLGELDFVKRRAVSGREHYRDSFEAPKARVLIVDDDKANLLVAEKLLHGTKVQIEKAGGGEECLRLTMQRRYDVIFMDHRMPEPDGIECFRAIRSQIGGLNPETPVVVLTANADSENQALYKREGFDGYLLKPVSGFQLEEELLRHLPRELVNMANAPEFKDVVVGPVLGHRKKLPIMVTTDSVSDLPADLVKKHRIEVLPYRVVTEGGEFLDGEEIETGGVLSYMADQNKQVRSEPPAAEDYEAFFAEQLTKAQYLIHVAMAKESSRGYESALLASKTFDNVAVVDSGHLSSGMGLLALYAAERAEAGADAADILAGLERMKSRARTSFIVGNTEYLARAGRIPAGINAVCEACLLHPVIVLKKSRMTVGSIYMGTRETVWKKYIRSALRQASRIDKRLLFITYAGLSQKDLEKIAEEVKERVHFETVIFQKASPAISANCGPDTFGLLFARKGEKETRASSAAKEKR